MTEDGKARSAAGVVVGRKVTRTGRAALACILALALAGCAIKRDDYIVPKVPLPETFLRDPAAGVVDAETAEAQADYLRETLPHWWRSFDSDELNGLVERALTGNGDLRMAALRVVQTHARLIQDSAALYPELDATLSAGADAPKDGIGTVAKGDDPVSERTFRYGLEMTWSPDIWGEHSAQAEAANETVRAAIFSRDQTRVRIINEVVATYLRYLSLGDRIATARDVTRAMVEMLDSLRAKLRDNDTTALRVAQQQSVAYASIAAIPDLEMQREQAHDRLAYLLGMAPGGLTLDGASLADLRLPPVPQGLPPRFILNRPDVRDAEAQLLAADANIDVARARVLPPLDLRAGYGYGSTYISQLLTPEGVVWSLLATLTTNIFDAGQRTAAVTQNRARHLELTEGYVQTVYQAVRSVEDALSAQTHLARRLAAQETSVGASESAYRLSRESHAFGSVDYLTVLDSERTYLRALDDFHQIRLARYIGMADFFQALGGGATFVAPDQDAADTMGATASDTMEYGADAAVVGTTVEALPQGAEPHPVAVSMPGGVAVPSNAGPLDTLETKPMTTAPAPMDDEAPSASPSVPDTDPVAPDPGDVSDALEPAPIPGVFPTATEAGGAEGRRGPSAWRRVNGVWQSSL